MMEFKYGEFSEGQVSYMKEFMRKQIFFLLLIVDENTRDDYKNIDVNEVFESTLTKIGGLNELLSYPHALVNIVAQLEAARIEYNKDNFTFKKYRKLILDAGAEVLKIKEV